MIGALGLIFVLLVKLNTARRLYCFRVEDLSMQVLLLNFAFASTQEGNSIDVYLPPPLNKFRIQATSDNLYFSVRSLNIHILLGLEIYRNILHSCKIRIYLSVKNVHYFSISAVYWRSDCIAARGKMIQSQLCHPNCTPWCRKFINLVTWKV